MSRLHARALKAIRATQRESHVWYEGNALPVWSCVDNARKPALASWDPGEWVGLGGEILTFPDTLTTQGLSLWSMVFQHSDTRAYN